MRDFNFFEPYIKETKKTDMKDLIIVGLATVISFIIIVYPIFKYIELRSIQKEVLALDQVLESADNVERINIIDEKKSEVLLLEEEKEVFEKLKERLDEREVISDLLIYEILGRVPGGISFDSLNINDGEIQIKGKTIYKTNIAQMEYNLRNSTYIHNVFIPSITEATNYYDFSIQLKIKDVVTNEAE